MASAQIMLLGSDRRRRWTVVQIDSVQLRVLDLLVIEPKGKPLLAHRVGRPVDSAIDVLRSKRWIHRRADGCYEPTSVGRRVARELRLLQYDEGMR